MRKLKDFKVFVLLSLLMFFGLGLWLSASAAPADKTLTPLAFLKAQELAHKAAKGEVYLGKVLTINYPINSARVGRKYQKLLLELSDVLKTRERKS